MRCPNCEKFVPLETQDVDPSDVDLDATFGDDTVVVTGDVTVSRTCAECGGDMKQFTYSLEGMAEIDAGDGCPHDSWSVEVDDVTVDEASTGGRRPKTTFVLNVSAKAKCDDCDKEVGVEMTGTAAASEFEEVA